jgi:hypothetical protein
MVLTCAAAEELWFGYKCCPGAETVADAPCPAGQHCACQGAFHSIDAQCTTGLPGQPCCGGPDCASGVCGDDNRCGPYPDIGKACARADECTTRACVGGQCRRNDGTCDADEDCDSWKCNAMGQCYTVQDFSGWQCEAPGPSHSCTLLSPHWTCGGAGPPYHCVPTPRQ